MHSLPATILVFLLHELNRYLHFNVSICIPYKFGKVNAELISKYLFCLMTFLSFNVLDVQINCISQKKKMPQNQDFACDCSRIICFQHSIFFISCSPVCFIIIFLTYLKQDKNATCGKPQFFQIGKFSALFSDVE